MVKELGLENAKASLVPGSKDEVKKADKFKNVDVAVDSIQKARESAGRDTWELET